MKTRTSPTGRPPREAAALRNNDGRQRQPQEGFTLLELLAVLALMALILGLTLPALTRSYRQEQDRAALRRLAATCRLARSQAATQRQRVRLFLDLRTGSYRLEGSPRGGELTGMLLKEASLVWLDGEKRRGYIAFYGDGSSSGGLLALQDRRGQRHVLEVEVITGRVSFRPG